MENVVNNRLSEVFEGKRVFITGHTGFKGAWLTLWLKELGAEVTGYALEPEKEGSHFEQLGLEDQIGHIVADIRNLDTLRDAVQEAQPEIVFHLAAQALVRYSYQNPIETYKTNVMGTLNVLEAARNSDSVR